MSCDWLDDLRSGMCNCFIYLWLCWWRRDGRKCGLKKLPAEIKDFPLGWTQFPTGQFLWTFKKKGRCERNVSRRRGNRWWLKGKKNSEVKVGWIESEMEEMSEMNEWRSGSLVLIGGNEGKRHKGQSSHYHWAMDIFFSFLLFMVVFCLCPSLDLISPSNFLLSGSSYLSPSSLRHPLCSCFFFSCSQITRQTVPKLGTCLCKSYKKRDSLCVSWFSNHPLSFCLSPCLAHFVPLSLCSPKLNFAVSSCLWKSGGRQTTSATGAF